MFYLQSAEPAPNFQGFLPSMGNPSFHLGSIPSMELTKRQASCVVGGDQTHRRALSRETFIRRGLRDKVDPNPLGRKRKGVSPNGPRSTGGTARSVRGMEPYHFRVGCDSGRGRVISTSSHWFPFPGFPRQQTVQEHKTGCQGGRGLATGRNKTSGSILPLPLTSCVTSGKPFNFSEPQLQHL